MRTGVRQLRLIRHLVAVALGERPVAAAAETTQQVRHFLAGRNTTDREEGERPTLGSRRLPPSEPSCAISQRTGEELRRLCSR